MASKPKLVMTDQRGERSEARQQLSEAIAKRDRKRQALQQAEAGIDHAGELVHRAEDHLQQAKAAIEEARQQQRQSIQAAAISGHQPGPDRQLRNARIALAEAEDQVQLAREARDHLRNRIGPLQQDLYFAENKVEQAAQAVIAAEIGDWSEQFLQLHRHYMTQLATLDWLIKRQIVPDTEDGRPTAAGSVVYNLQHAPQALLREMQSSQHPARIKWTEYFKALTVDADAGLPE